MRERKNAVAIALSMKNASQLDTIQMQVDDLENSGVDTEARADIQVIEAVTIESKVDDLEELNLLVIKKESDTDISELINLQKYTEEYDSSVYSMMKIEKWETL